MKKNLNEVATIQCFYTNIGTTTSHFTLNLGTVVELPITFASDSLAVSRVKLETETSSEDEVNRPAN